MAFLKIFFFLALLISVSSAARILSGSNTDKSNSDTDTTMLFKYHNGPLLYGKISINLIWYGNFKPSQKAIITDFVASLQSPTQSQSNPSVQAWWQFTEKYYTSIKTKNSSPLRLSLGKQISDEKYSLGKTLTNQQVQLLAAKADQSYAINVVLTSSDVAVEGFCSSKCGTHGSIPSGKKNNKFAYIWVGNSETQCPGQCAWPFHQPIYGPQGPPLVAPNDVGMDGMVINLAGLLAGTASNPFGNGFYQGPSEAPLEAASTCPGIYAKGAYPGFAGDLLVDPTTGASYNANGVNGRKYLVPALYDPSTQSCSTIV